MPLPIRLAPRCRLGEGARWDGERWWWLDVADGRGIGTVYVALPGGTPRRAFRARGRVSAIAPDARGGALVTCDRSLLALAPNADGFRVRHVVDLSIPAGHVLNDGIGDGHGGLVVGTVDPGGSATGVLLGVDAHGAARTIATGFVQSNGLAFAPDGSLFHADSSTRTVWLHRIDAPSTSFVQLGEDDGLPDGLCAAPDGDVWVAVYGAGEVRRYRRGAAVEVVQVPTPQATSVALGGASGRDLLVTSAREGFDSARSRREPLAGRLFTRQHVDP